MSQELSPIRLPRRFVFDIVRGAFGDFDEKTETLSTLDLPDFEDDVIFQRVFTFLEEVLLPQVKANGVAEVLETVQSLAMDFIRAEEPLLISDEEANRATDMLLQAQFYLWLLGSVGTLLPAPSPEAQGEALDKSDLLWIRLACDVLAKHIPPVDVEDAGFDSDQVDGELPFWSSGTANLN